MPSRAGSPNKNKQALIRLLQEKYPGYRPVLEMARIAHETEDPNLAAQMHKEVAQYVEPKRKAVEWTDGQGNSLAPAFIMTLNAPKN